MFSQPTSSPVYRLSHVSVHVLTFHSFLFFFPFSVLDNPEGNGGVLEVRSAVCASGPNRDENPQSILHLRGCVPLHRPAVQQRVNGQRGKRSIDICIHQYHTAFTRHWFRWPTRRRHSSCTKNSKVKPASSDFHTALNSLAKLEIEVLS